jgi:hypothetical protein
LSSVASLAAQCYSTLPHNETIFGKKKLYWTYNLFSLLYRAFWNLKLVIHQQMHYLLHFNFT